MTGSEILNRISRHYQYILDAAQSNLNRYQRLIDRKSAPENATYCDGKIKETEQHIAEYTEILDYLDELGR